MVIAILTPMRLFAESLAAALQALDPAALVLIADTFSLLRETFTNVPVDIALIDVTEGIELDEVREIAARWPAIALLALGLKLEQKEVVRCARAGFASYIPNGASIVELQRILRDVASGQLRCPPDISAALFRSLCRPPRAERAEPALKALTARECDVLRELGQGHSNKEIARELDLSISTVKHHVHSILEKLQVGCRAQAMRKVRDTPWMLGSTPANGNANNKLDKGDAPIWITVN
jgi:two-component system nitrate/nitrite response regulator NarL